ncbi:MAG: hypothetical protein WKF86_04820 [Acidimicrobiales bacterium]
MAEPQAKSLLTASRTIDLARQLGIRRIELVGNRAQDGDTETLHDFARRHQVNLAAVVPEDQAVIQADRDGVCILDRDPQAQAVQAIETLASTVTAGS